MRRIRTAILLMAIFISLNGKAFQAVCSPSSNANAGGESPFVSENIGAENGFEAPQKQKAKKPSTQKPPSKRAPTGGVSGGVPGGVPGGVQGGTQDDVPPPPPPPPPRQGSIPAPSVIRKSGGVLAGSAIKKVEPNYPPLAKAAQVSGAVVVEVTLDEEGKVIAARALSGHPLLKDAATKAARGWEFTKTMLSGKLVKVIGTITFTFILGKETPTPEAESEPEVESKADDSLSQRLPGLVQKREELEKDAIKRVVPVFSPRDKATYTSDALDVEVVVDEQGNVIDAQPLSGHPLRRYADEAARQWKFKPTLRAGKPVKVTGILIFRVAEGGESEQEKIWQTHLKDYQEQSAKKSPDQKKLAIVLANLAVTAVEADKESATLNLFEEAERRNQLPTDAKPYYAQLIVDKYDDDLEQARKNNRDDPTSEKIVAKALTLFTESYNEELQKKPLDGRKQFDIAASIISLQRRFGTAEEQMVWLTKMLEIPGLSDKRRALVNYSLGVAYWKTSYEMSLPFTSKRQAIPANIATKMQPAIHRGREYIERSLAAAPDFPDAWFYKKMLSMEEMKIEKNVQRQKLLQQEQTEAQNRYVALVTNQRQQPVSMYESSDKTYASGLPALPERFVVASPPPPPPPPPPPAAMPKRVTRQTGRAPRPPQGSAKAQRPPQAPPLITAAKQLNLARIKALLAQKANVNAKDAEGKTALMHALSIAGGTATEVIDELLKHEMDVNAKDHDGATALLYAVISGYTSHIQTLIDKGAGVNAQEGDGYTALMYAAENDKAEIVRILLDNGADVNLKNSDGDTASSLAEQEGHTEIVEMLRKHSSDPKGETRQTSAPKGLNEKDDSGETALTRAAKAERLQEVKALLDRGANANVKNDDNQTPLLIAIKNNNSEIAQALLDKGADANSKSDYDGSALMIAIKNRNPKIVQALLAKGADPIAKSGFGDTPLEEAEESGNMEIILAVFGKLTDLNAKNRQGLTPLMRAARAGRKEVVQVLLANGADVNAKGAMGSTALAQAFEKKRTEIARTLIAKGAVIDTIALINAIGSGLTEFVKLALDKGADVNASALLGVTPLMGAIMEGRTEIARMLIEKGANVNATMAFGIMPLMGAAMEDNAEIVQMLLDKGADVNAKSIMNKTALISCGAKTVRMLLAKGADVNAKNDEGDTALMEATTKGRLEVVQALLEKGVDVNAKDKRGRTALALAESEGQTRIVQVLLAKGADVTLKDNEGKTALMIAAANGASDVVQALIDKRADVNAKDTAGKTPLMHATNKGQSEIVT